MHIAVIGTGRVGRPTAYNILIRIAPEELTVCDTKPGLAKAFREDLSHAAVAYGIDTTIHYAEKDEDVSGADIIVISAGRPRLPGEKISRRDLRNINAKIVRDICLTVKERNKGAKYFVVTNPVDAMAMICYKYTKASFVVSFGTNLETERLHTALSRFLNVPLSKVQGYVGGEHGENAVVLWSTVKIEGKDVEAWCKERGMKLNKSEIELYIKKVSRIIIEGVGGTEYGPAASFSRIIRAVIKNTDEILPIATPMKFKSLPEPVWVSVPIKLGLSLGPSLYEYLTEEEKKRIEEAAKAIYQTYIDALEVVEKE